MRGFKPIRCLCICAWYLQLHRLMRYLHRKKIIILMYHGFTDKRAHEGIENSQGLHLDIKGFKLQIEYLKKYYNVISLGRLIEYYSNGAEIPPNAAVITIDDGYKSSYTLAYPVLKQFNVPAAIFLTTDFIDKKEPLWHDRVEYAVNMAESNPDFKDNNSRKLYCRKIVAKLKSMPQESREGEIESLERRLGQRLSLDKAIPEIYRPLEWDEVLEMVKSGIISMGSHTCTHVILTRSNPERQKKELVLSKQVIENKTASSCRLFCYPNGLAGDFDYRTKDLLKESGYSCGLTAVEGMNDAYSDVFELKRLAVDNREGLITFMMTLSGIFKFLVDTKQSILKS